MDMPARTRTAAPNSTAAGRWHDEPSMRLLELGVAAVSLAAAVILALAR
jgi:hypothetical protein